MFKIALTLTPSSIGKYREVQEVQRSTEKYREVQEVQRSTEKYREVQKSDFPP